MLVSSKSGFRSGVPFRFSELLGQRGSSWWIPWGSTSSIASNVRKSGSIDTREADMARGHKKDAELEDHREDAAAATDLPQVTALSA